MGDHRRHLKPNDRFKIIGRGHFDDRISALSRKVLQTSRLRGSLMTNW